MGDRDDLDLDSIRRTLTGELDTLAASSAAGAAARRPVTLDQQSVGRLSRMDAMQVQAMAQASDARRRHRARRIEAALRRLDEDDFGCCARCGEAIPAKRLAIDPALAHCVDCAP